MPDWSLAAAAKPPGSFLSPPRRGFLFAFALPVAVALKDGDVGMMQQAVEQGDDTGGVGEYLVPFLEGAIGGEDDRLALVTPVDDFIE